MFKKLYLLPILIIAGLAIPAYFAFAGTAVTWNGTSYTIPSVGEENWFGADKVDGFLIALGNHSLQKSGGAFTLTSELDFGATAGVIGSYFGTRSSNDSTAGVFRLSNAESIGWRNAANGANLLLTVDSSNNLSFNGAPIASSSGVVPVTAGGTGLSSYSVGQMLYVSTDPSVMSKLSLGTTDYVIKSNGTLPVYGQIVNASIDNSAAIARSKLGTGSADHVVINSGAGAFSSEATLAVTRGGTNIGSYSVGDLLYATPNSSTLTKLPIGSTGNILKVAGGVPTWGSAATTASISSLKTSDYTITSSDDVVQVSPTTGTVILSLPLASANSGKVYYIERPAISNGQIARVSAASGDTLDELSTLILGSRFDSVAIVSDGVNVWRSIAKNIAVAVRAVNNANGSYTGDTTNIDFTTETYDSHNAWNGTVFTAPMDGTYSIRGRWLSDSAVSDSTDLYVVNVFNLRMGTSASATYHDFNGAVRLLANQTMSIRSSGTDALNTSATAHWIAIERIGN